MTNSHNISMSKGLLCSGGCEECERIAAVLPKEALAYLAKRDEESRMNRWAMLATAQYFEQRISRLLDEASTHEVS
jgi:hypothetical protein